jgi:hypothetical protein
MAGADGPVVGVSALGVGCGQPTHEGGEVAILAGPQQQMEAVGHQVVSQQSHVEASDGLPQDALERSIVGITIDDNQLRIRPV